VTKVTSLLRRVEAAPWGCASEHRRDSARSADHWLGDRGRQLLVARKLVGHRDTGSPAIRPPEVVAARSPGDLQ